MPRKCEGNWSDHEPILLFGASNGRPASQIGFLDRKMAGQRAKSVFQTTLMNIPSLTGPHQDIERIL
jgi:hypothetical protein